MIGPHVRHPERLRILFAIVVLQAAIVVVGLYAMVRP